MTIDKALERLNNKLSLIAAAGGIAAAVAPEKILPFLYSHKVIVCIYLVVGVAPIQEFFHPIKTCQTMRKDLLGIAWLAKFGLLWFLVVLSGVLLIRQRGTNLSRVVVAHDNPTLWTAASSGDVPQVERLLREGAPISGKDKAGMTALHYAAQSKNLQLVRFLIQRGADVNAKANENVTPLYLSLDMAFGQPVISLELIKSGADVSTADSKVGDTPLLIAATESSYEVMQALLRKGANPNAQNHSGDTPLHHAAQNAMLDRVQLLLQYGANPSIRNLIGKSAIDMAQTTNPDPTVRKHFEQTRDVLLAALRSNHRE